MTIDAGYFSHTFEAASIFVWLISTLGSWAISALWRWLVKVPDLSAKKPMSRQRKVIREFGRVVCIALSTLIILTILPLIGMGSSGKLGGRITRVLVGGTQNPDVTAVTFFIRLVNSGADSITSAWKLDVKLPTGNKFNCEAPPFDWKSERELEALDSDGVRRKHKLPSRDYLPTMNIDAPILHGSGVGGWVAFDVSKLPTPLPMNSELTVSFRDAYDRTIKLKTIWGEASHIFDPINEKPPSP